jgi:hypothetical protein
MLRRHTLRNTVLLILGLLFAAAAVVGLLGKGSWTIIDKPGRWLHAEASMRGWHFAYVSIPEASSFPAATYVPDGARDTFDRRMNEMNPVFEFHRFSVRSLPQFLCEMERQRILSLGRTTYAADIWRTRFGGTAAPNLPGPTTWIAGFPAWWLVLPAVCLLFIPAYASWDRRRRLRWLRYCRTCGYDLTGNTTGVCSECGAPLPPDMQVPTPSTQHGG